MMASHSEAPFRGVGPAVRALCAGFGFWLCIFAVLLEPQNLRAETVLDIPLHGAGYGTAFFEDAARRFEQLNPGVKVRISGDPRMADKLRIRAIGGNYPDATTAELYWPKLIKAGRVVNLRPYLDGPNWEGDGRWADSFVPGALDAWTEEGRVYGLPFAYSCWSIFYNKRLFRELGLAEPRTWDEFFAVCAKLRAAGLAPLALPGVYLRYGDAFLRAALYNLAGPEGWRAYNGMEPGTRDNPNFERAAGVLSRLADGCLIEGWQGLSHTGAQLAFLEGRAAMTVSGSWFVNEMKGKIPDDFELGTMNFPVWADGRADPSAVQTSSEYFFLFENGDPAKERLLVDFFRFLTSRERAQAFVRLLDSPVAVKGIPEEAYSPFMRQTAAIIGRARQAYSAPPNMLQSPGLMQALTDERLKLFNRETSPRDFAQNLERAARAEKQRESEPERIEVKHPLGAATLCLGVLAVGGFWLWRLKTGRERAAFSDTRPKLGAGSALGFVGPALGLYAAFILLPALVSLGWAFMHWDGIGAQRWAGLFNFKWLLLESDVFWAALRNNLFLVIVPAAVVVPLSLALAHLIHRGTRGASILKAVLLFPNLLGGIAATLLWMNIYEPRGGLAGAALGMLGRLAGSETLAGLANHPWLAPQYLYWSMVPIYIWMACGFNLVLYLAAMEGIDQDLYEAASIDGASRLRQFFCITLPQIKETIAVSAVFIVIGGLNAFDMIWLLTSQDPPTGSHTMGTLLVTTLFKEFQVGRATAIAVVMLVLVLAASVLILHARKEEES
jgi:raffinose/stachyose/melibiose transport system permease protein